MILIVFPHAGGFAGYYSFMKEFSFCQFSDVYIYEYPGRGRKSMEKPCESLNELSIRAALELESVIGNQECVFFGHSMGALVAYETIKAIFNRQGKMPKLFIASGEVAPDNYKGVDVDYNSEEAVCNYICSMGGTSAELLEIPEAKDFFVPIIQMDLKIASNYTPTHFSEQPLTEYVLVMYGELDLDITNDNIKNWIKVGRKSLGNKIFSGNHFYMNENQEEFLIYIDQITRIINEELVSANVR